MVNLCSSISFILSKSTFQKFKSKSAFHLFQRLFKINLTAAVLKSSNQRCTGHDVMFSSNVTPELDMRKAYEMGAYINLDDATHVEFLPSVVGSVPETVCLRYNPGGSFSLGNTIMDMPRDAKYGMTEDQMAGAINRLMNLGTKHFGIHAFLASNTTTNEYYPELAANLFRLAVRLRNATGAHISFINLSGGVGVPYRPEQKANDIAIIGDNGVGKSTLFKCIIGEQKQDTGTIRFGAGVDIGYYDQHQAGLHDSKTVLDEVWDDFRRLEFSADGQTVHNPTDLELWFDTNGSRYSVKPGETITL